MIQKEIQNLIFDLGGVLLNLHLDRTHEAFARASGQTVAEIKARIEQTPFFNDYEKGLHSDAEFRSRVRDFLGADLSDAQIDHAWNAMLGDIPPERLQLLERLRPHYRLFLLSNTNQIHLDHFTGMIKQTTGNPSLSSYFEKAYYSHLMKMRKPDREIFDYVIDEHKLDPARTLFLDDNLSNLEGATAVGLRTFHVQQPQKIFTMFS